MGCLDCKGWGWPGRCANQYVWLALVKLVRNVDKLLLNSVRQFYDAS